LNFTASGLPYWTTDIGGYSGGNPEDPKYREVFTRWWQYGVFCPIFRSHGRRYSGDTKGPNELWAYGPQTQKICTDFDSFRYRLLPYVYSLAGDVAQENYTPMRLLAFDFPKDRDVWNITDQFMYGPSLLICPVTDSGATTRKVYLPGGSNWTNFWTGEIQTGGQTIGTPAPIEQLPIFVKCGSILPLGPLQQYVEEHSADTLELRVYAGADAQFELYEDDGVTYDYKEGQSSRILFKWSDRAETLTIKKRKGAFPGMLKKRMFRIVWVDQKNGRGFSTAHDAVNANYSGEEVVIERPKAHH
jgi:alpha-D-xyloside xylohydrolase